MFLGLLAALLTVSCGAPQTDKNTGSAPPKTASGQTKNGQAEPGPSDFAGRYESFAQAHDAFTTTLTREENNDYSVPAPPEGLFDLVSYPSKVGDLAAYVSGDPGDGQKHPLIIWVVGGWGNAIDDFPWVYPNWDNDQTGSAFWQAGLLTM